MNSPTSRTEAPGGQSSPWSYIPTLYFPLGMMGVLSVWQIMQLFKLLGYPNYIVSLISGLGLLGSLRFLYVPWLDRAATKRKLSLFSIGAGVVLYFVIGAIIGLQPTQSVLVWTLFPALLVLAVISTAYETAIDGYYIRALDEKDQAKFIGIKTAGYRLGSILVGTGFGWIFAKIAAHHGSFGPDSEEKSGFYLGAATVYISVGLLTLGLYFWNRKKTPHLANDTPVTHTQFALREIFRDYFSQKYAGRICAVILFYRLGEGFLHGMMGPTGIIGPFYLDPVSKGGMGVSLSSGPIMAAIGGMPMSIIGGILGGFIIKWWGLKRTFVPLALAMSLPNLASVFLSLYQPQTFFMLFGEEINTWLLLGASLENFTYGMSFSAVSYYMFVMASESGRNKTSILAVSNALQYVSFFLPMMLSGAAHAWLGYTGAFILSVTCGLPAVFIIPYLPMPKCESERNPAARSS